MLDSNSVSQNIQDQIDDIIGELADRVLGQNIPFLAGLLFDKSGQILGVMSELKTAIDEALDGLGSISAEDLVQILNSIELDQGIAPITVKEDGDDLSLIFEFDGISEIGGVELDAGTSIGISADAFKFDGAVAADIVLGASFGILVDAATGDAELNANLTDKEFTIQVNGEIDFDLDADNALGFLDIDLSDNDVQDPEEPKDDLDLLFTVDLTDVGDPTSVSVTGTATLDTNVMVAAPDVAILPEFGANVFLQVSYANSDLLDDGSAIDGDFTIELRDVQFKLEALASVLQDVFSTVSDILNTFPLGEIVDMLTARLPVVDDLAPSSFDFDNSGEITLQDVITFIAIFAPDGPPPAFGFIQGVILLAEVIDAVDELAMGLAEDGCFDIGTLRLTSDALDKISSGATFPESTRLISSENSDLANLADLVEAFGAFTDYIGLDEEVENASAPSNAAPLEDTHTTQNAVANPAPLALANAEGPFDVPELGLSFPFLDSPEALVQSLGSLLLNGVGAPPVTLVEFDLPPLEFDTRGEIGINFGIFVGYLVGTFYAGVDVNVGYDTAGFGDNFDFAEGLFISPDLPSVTVNGEEKAPVGTVSLGVGVGGGIDVVIARVAVEGGLMGTIDVFLGGTGPGDNKARLSELGGCFFNDIAGRITAGIDLVLKFGFGIFSFEKRQSLATVTLAQFNIDPCNPKPSEIMDQLEVENAGLADILGDGALTLNVGERAEFRGLPDDADAEFDSNGNRIGPAEAETFFVGMVPEDEDNPAGPGEIGVFAFGIFERFGDGTTGLKAIVGSGGSMRDTLTVSASINLDADLSGGDGNDFLVGGGGDDRLRGDADNDQLDGDFGDDTLEGGTGNDILRGGAGADSLDGGAGFDQVDFSQSDTGITLVESTSTPGLMIGSGGEAQGDRLRNVEHFIGSEFDDTFYGNRNVANVFEANAGNDVLVGGDEGDLFIGGRGADVLRGNRLGATNTSGDAASYVFSASGVLINLNFAGYGIGIGGDAQGDLLFGIEDVQLSRHGDRFIGDAEDNLVDGYDGDDILEGGLGRDTINGGVGDDVVYARGDRDDLDGGGFLNYRADTDLLSYEQAQGAVNVNLSTGNGRLKSNLLFGDDIAFAQLIRFDPDGENEILSRSGNENIKISSFENLTGSAFDDDLTGDDLGNVIRGELGNDLINGDGGDDTLIGGFGSDTLNGDLGIDTADYRDSNARVLVDLETGSSGGHAQGDVYNDVENLIGSRFNDVLNGNELNNRLDPFINIGNGREELTGRDGVDTAVLDFSEDESAAIYSVTLTSTGSGSVTRFPTVGIPESLVTLNTIEQLEVFTQGGNDLVRSQQIGNDIVNTGGGNDLASLGDGSDQVFTGEGDDAVLRSSAASLVEGLYLGAGVALRDTFILDGGRDIDTLFADISYTAQRINWIGEIPNGTESNRKILLEGGGVIQNFEILSGLITGGGNDSVGQFGEFNNVFSTKGGSDLVIAGLGNDIADGGTSSTGILLVEDVDTLVVDYSGMAGQVLSTDAINSLYEGTISFDAQTGSDDADASVTHRNFERILLKGTDFGGHLIGADATYFDLIGDTPGDILTGGAGRDLIEGLAGDDTLIGGEERDTLVGGAGDDVLIGGASGGPSEEQDQLTGGFGADLFVVGDQNGNIYDGVEDQVAILDLNIAQGDRVQLAGTPGDYTLEHSDPIFLGNAAIYFTQIQIPNPNNTGLVTIATVTSINEQFSLTGPYVEYVGPSPSNAAAPAQAITVASEITDSIELTSALWQSGVVSDEVLLRSVSDAQAQGPQNAPELANMVTPGAPNITPTEISAVALFAINDAIEDFAVELANFDNFSIYNIVEVTGSASASGTFENMFGLDEGFVLSTGRVSDILGENTIDGRFTLGPRPGNEVALDFVNLGSLDGSGTLYRALVPDLPGGIESLVLQDDNDLVGGASGFYSAFDLDTVFFSEDLLEAANNLTRLEFNNLNKVGAIEYSAAGISFTPGYARPSATAQENDLNGSVNGLVDHTIATLDVADGAGRSGNMSLGDGGVLEFDLLAPVNSTSDDPTYLYVYELGAPENLESVGRVSDKPIGVAGDLSTDLGAPGIAGDTTTLTSTFTVDFSGANGPQPGFSEYTEIDFFDVVIVSEELPERGGAELPDLVTVRINGVDVLRDGNGDVVTLNTLANTPFGDYAPELTLNLIEDGPKVDEIRADAYTSVYRISGPIVNGENTIEISVSDQADALLDTAIFIAPLGDDAGPAANNAPIARNDSLRVNEGGTASINVIIGDGLDTDADGDQLTVNQAALLDGNNNIVQLLNIGTATQLNDNRGIVTVTETGDFTFAAGSSFDDLETDQIATLQFSYQVSDATASDTANVTVIVDGIGSLNTAPEFTSPQRFTTPENVLQSFQALAVDTDGPSAISYSFAFGSDEEFFTIDASTGAFRFLEAPDFETPLDDGSNNVYDLEIQASDGQNTTVQSVSVLVENVEEPCDGLNKIQGTNSDDELRATEKADCFETGAGRDEIRASLATINGDLIRDFSIRDTIRLEGTHVMPEQVTIMDGSAIFNIETGGTEVSFTLAGDFSGQSFELLSDGADTLITIAGPGASKLSSSGERFITTDAGENRAYGDAGDDVIGTAAGKDILSGGGGADVMLAGDDADILIGGRDADRLTGGKGEDIFAFDISDFAGGNVVADFITDFEVGIDKIELSGFGIKGLDDLKFLTVATGAAINLGDGAFIVLEGLQEGELTQEDVIGLEEGRMMSLVSATNLHVLTDANDRFVTTDPGANEVHAGAGIDAIIGGAGPDVLRGEDGDDLMIGGPGDDRMIGGEGADRMTGRDGADSFEFTKGEETGFVAEFITDFEKNDTVLLNGFGFETSEDLKFQTLGSGDLALSLTQTRFVVFEGITEEEELTGTFEFG